jgi:cobyrinic acid a,c-diamide synthase
MVLGETLVDADGVAHRMTGLLGASSSFAKRKMHLGYRDVTLEADCSLGRKGARLRGHEFHYATGFDGAVPDQPFAMAADAQGNPPMPSGTRRGRVTGSFFHAVATRD